CYREALMLDSAVKIHDISPLISEKTAVFPGDRSFSREVVLSLKHGHNITLSSIQCSVHIGAHTDAPNHYDPKGSGIESRDLRPYIGQAQVITVKKPPGTRILPADLKKPIVAPRLLFRTLSFPDPERWNGDFVSLSAELIDYLHQYKVRLVGIDTPSVDLADDKILESHQKIAAYDMAILEGIILTDVPDGLYTLVALPLKIKDADASPVRAILLEA
ncbi:MAG: cyclase family protein, partial [Bdellovibrionaceae bacterium]|nr:cyclase family protein [Pseudobdellovibrionaceae bacterium]